MNDFRQPGLQATETASSTSLKRRAADNAELELFRSFFINWRPAQMTAIILFTVIATFIYFAGQTMSAWWWLLMQSTMVAINSITCRIYEQRHLHGTNYPEHQKWVLVFTVETAISGATMGSLLWIAAPGDGMLIAALSVATIGLGYAIACGHRYIVYANTFGAMLTMLSALLFRTHSIIAVVACLLIGTLILAFGLNHYKAMLAVTLSKFQTQRLMTELEKQRSRMLMMERHEAVHEERRRLMHDIHDGFGASLTSMLMLLEHGQLDIKDAAKVVRDSLDDMRLVIESTEPSDGNLVALLANMRYRLGQRLEKAGLTIDWQVHELPALEWLSSSSLLQITRIFQEAITNIIKHSHASVIRISTHRDAASIRIDITDNGQGFDVESVRQGLGLRHMERRAKAVHGQLAINSTKDTGTVISLELPIAIQSTD